MTIQFRDIVVRPEHMFTLGVEQISGRFYVSIPVSNGVVDYEEYYEIDRVTFDLFSHDPDAALPFVSRCRRRELDGLLIIPPGTNRGAAI